MKSGDILGARYRLEQQIGSGAMGAVWAAYDVSSNVRVALKLILPQSREHQTNDLRQRLLREARACGKLRHRNIVQIFDVGETPQGEPFLVLELLHGQTLGDLLKEKRRIEPVLAARIAGEIASALAVAHAAHVIHRDLKPANIFLHREEGMAEDMFVSKVLDFGVCKNLDSVDSVATQTGTAVGSPAYMSPEQVGMRKDLDHGTDIWSLGIVLYEMLTGARPFTGSVQEVIRHILLTPIPPPSAKVRDVPPELDVIVARCTAAKRADRYANGDELARALFAIAGTPRPMIRKATFTGMGPLPSATGPERPPTLNPMEATAPLIAATPRAPMGLMPEADDLSDLEATMPLQGRMLMNIRQNAPPAARGEDASTGTQLLQPSQPIASPAPAWKQELNQVLAAHRQSYASLDGALPEQATNGQTQMITPELQASVAGRMDHAGTTSAAGALSHGTGGYPAPPMPMMPMMDPAVATGRQKRGKGVLFGVMGVGVVAAAGVIGLLVVNVGTGGSSATPSMKDANAEGSSVVAAPKAPEAVPVVEPLPRPPVKAEATAEVEAVPVETTLPKPAPAATSAPVAPVAPKPAPTPTYQPPVAKATVQTAKPAPKGPVCTGVGLFKKCK